METYIPQISEFHIGFEYLIKTDHDHIKEVYDGKTNLTLIAKELKQGRIVVKYIDKEDLQAIGLKEHEKYKGKYYFGTDATKSYRLLVFNDKLITKHHETYKFITLYNIYFESAILFEGNIKNISELKRILKQTNSDKIEETHKLLK